MSEYLPWQEALNISNMPHIDEAIRTLVDDSTEDNAVSLVKAIIHAAAVMPAAIIAQEVVSNVFKDEVHSAKSLGFHDYAERLETLLPTVNAFLDAAAPLPIGLNTVGWAQLASNGNIRYWHTERQKVEDFAESLVMKGMFDDCQIIPVFHMSIDQSEPEEVPEVWVRDDERTETCTLLVNDVAHFTGEITLERIAGWSDAECQAVEEYCIAIHVNASDNDDVVIPPKPAVLTTV